MEIIHTQDSEEGDPFFIVRVRRGTIVRWQSIALLIVYVVYRGRMARR